MTRKSQYGWMVVGGILCLCGGVVALKVREGNPALAQVETPPPQPVAAVDPPPPPGPDAPPPASPDATPKAADHEGVAPLGPLAPPSPYSGGVAPPPAPTIDPLPAPTAAVEPAPPSPPQPPLPPAPEPTVTPPAPVQPPVPAVPPMDPPAPAPPKVKAPPPVVVVQVSQIGEPPLAGTGPLQNYVVHTTGETMRDISRRTLGTGERCTEVYRLNPALHPEDTLAVGTLVHLPPDACLPADEVEGLKPLPAMRPTTAPARPRSVMALTGTYPCNIDDQRGLTLPRAVREQFGDADLVLVSPGPDQCLWLTDQAHQERLAERLEHSPAREVDVRVFKRLYYAQTEKVTVGADGRVLISDRLMQFAGLGQEAVLVGIDDHFEVWDAARWKQYTQSKSAAAASGSE